MAIKTFNIDKEVYKKFMEFCKEHGISMSRQVEIFMKAQLEESQEQRNQYLEQLESIRKLSTPAKPQKHNHSYFG